MRKCVRTPNTNNINGFKKLLKPVVEKKRRDRINRSLSDLRFSLLNHTSDVRLQNPKLEKADILDLTVEYLQKKTKRELRTMSHIQPLYDVSQTGPLQYSDPRPSVLPILYSAGFQQCFTQLVGFMRRATPTERDGLLQGETSCMDKQYSDTFSPWQPQFSENTDFHHPRLNGKPDTQPIKEVFGHSKQEAVKSALTPYHSFSQPGRHTYPSSPACLSPPLSPCSVCSSSAFNTSSVHSLSCHFLPPPPRLSPFSSALLCSCSLAALLHPSPTVPLLSPPNLHLPPLTSQMSSPSRQELLSNFTQLMWRPWF